jgi:DNA-binding GntR family transcriptional regulator
MPVPKRDSPVVSSRRLLTEQLFDGLRDDIVRGVLAPGQRIHDLELAGRLGLSRATVRTALLRLTRIGLVESVPNLYTRVTPIDLERYLETQDTARALYLFAARYGTVVLTDEQISTLRARTTGLGSRDSVDPEPIFSTEPEAGFFQVFVDAVENRPLRRTLARLRPHLQRVMGQYAQLLPAREIDDALGRAVEAATVRDEEGVSSALTDYFDVGLGLFHDRLRALPEFQGD